MFDPVVLIKRTGLQGGAMWIKMEWMAVFEHWWSIYYTSLLGDAV